MKFSELPNITHGQWLQFTEDAPISHLLSDSRKAIVHSGSVFFAIKGDHHDGHRYIQDLCNQGIRYFVVDQELHLPLPGSVSVLRVKNVLKALQAIAAAHRSSFQLPIIGITGSNGKTIVKEWLSKALSLHRQVVKSPRSFNSQLGVPLSVWALSENDEIGIFEAGISKPYEMQQLATIIQPTLGIFTNIGSAHDSGFKNREEKILEKLLLFEQADTIIYCRDHEEIHSLIGKQYSSKQLLGWSAHDATCALFISQKQVEGRSTFVRFRYHQLESELRFPFADAASLENGMHVLACMLQMDFSIEQIQQSLASLEAVSMRLELKNAINGSYLINDSYNNDLAGLAIALDFLAQQQQREKRTVILSDILESGLSGELLYQHVADLLHQKKVDRLIGIGPDLHRYSSLFSIPAQFYENTASFLTNNKDLVFQQELILVKGARKFEFERIAQLLQEKIHGTVLEINLDALTHNLNFYRSKLTSPTKLMVMVKAFAYGSGSFEIANLLQFHKVDYLAVAYADEGVGLRQNGIKLPIMVMNPSPESLDKLIQYQLEPEIYSWELLQNLLSKLQTDQGLKIHIKVDSGMRRLGFEKPQLPQLIELLQSNKKIEVASVFTHLAGSDNAEHNAFSHQQVAYFNDFYANFCSKLGYQPWRHVLNSPGIIRFPEYHFEMVRLGIGLYGLEVNGIEPEALQTISRLKTTISQIKHIPKGESVGYSRTWQADRDTTSATIAIGYADGFDRGFSNGIGHVMVNGIKAPVIGSVCMDMTMIDITNIEAQVGDEVLIFGPELPITELAAAIGTIPYEILTNVSDRVKRVFYTE